MWMLKSFGMVAGCDGKGDRDPVVKDFKEEWCIMATGGVGCN